MDDAVPPHGVGTDPSEAGDQAWWPDAIQQSVDSAVASARSGRSTTVVVEGDPGMGKSTLLDEIAARAGDFVTLSADGYDGSVSPYAALDQWGVPTPPTTRPFLAAQQLRDRIDSFGGGVSVLVRLDDLQWVDPESVEALAWLVRRAAGDRLLVLVGTRPLPASQFPTWQRWTRTSATVTRLRLNGLTQDLALRMARRRHPSIPETTVRTLWSHTGGNPLYLSELLTEHDPSEVSRMRVLPAPAEFEQVVADRLERLDRLDPDAVTLVRACAVLGTGWTPLTTLASVADVVSVLDAADRAEAAGLVTVGTSDGAPAVRPHHALTRSAVYYATPLRDRRDLHLRAAAVAGDLESRLEHRVQASTSFDAELADDLDTEAAALHARRSFRLAGQFLEWASLVTLEPGLRERRRLDGLFERQLAGQVEVPDRELALLAHTDSVRVLLLRGHSALLAGRPAEAVRHLSRAVTTDGDLAGSLPLARAGVLLASAHLRAGASAETIRADLDAARAAGPTDPALRFREFFCEAVTQARSSSAEAILEQLAFLPVNVSEVAPRYRDQLNWRGMMRLVVGLIPEGLADLREGHERAVLGDGATDVVDGAQLAFLGAAHWQHGQWDRAKVVFNLLEEIAANPQALAQAYLCLLPASSGDFAAADLRLARVIESAEREPWQEAVQAVLVARVVRAHAGADRDQQGGLLADMRTRWSSSFVDTGVVSSVWFMHAVLAAIWADELDVADHWTARLERPGTAARWAPAAAHWLRGLAAEARGDHDDALAHLRAATATPSTEIPFYLGHMLSDLARMALRHNHTHESGTARLEAERIYRRLGARSYLTSPPPEQVAPQAAVTSVPPTGLRDRFGLSEREEDVATLVADGMSYNQVAKELFITRSTVGFHLGNVYAKVGVASRHELRDLTRPREAVRPGGRR